VTKNSNEKVLNKPEISAEAIADMPVGFHGKFCMMVNGERHTWFIQSLVKATANLPVVDVVLTELDKYLDENAWFHGDNEPTIRSLIEHYLRVEQTDLSFPIIMNPKIGVLDGLHRIVKAHTLGLSSIKAVTLVNLPKPDYIGDF
jgi:hypothetical protein